MDKRTKHGMHGTRFYNIWNSMKKRCLTISNNSYKRYGGSGITISDEWKNFINFKEDMYQLYLNHIEEFGERETSIDRIDNNKGYSKENCRWATLKEQRLNQTRSECPKKFIKIFKAISPDGIEYISNNQAKFAREHNLSKGSIHKCIHGDRRKTNNWKFELITA